MTTETKNIKESSILIGGKPFINYVTGVILQFNNGISKTIIKARGKFISKCVDVAEIARKKFPEEEVSVQDVSIGSEKFENKEAKMVNVSTIEITLLKSA
ncbi:MAG: DNA-binding protein Alba [archaeon]